MYGSFLEYSSIFDDLSVTETNYEFRESLAVNQILSNYCLDFPSESDFLDLSEETQKKIKYAIYYQIYFASNNEYLLSGDDKEKYSSVTLGRFNYTVSDSNSNNIQMISANTKTFLDSTSFCKGNVCLVEYGCDYTC